MRKLNNILNDCSPKKKHWVLFPNEIAANQLQQAGGTCYMVSALEAISHIPFLLNSIFDNTFTQYSEKYKVNLKKKLILS